MAKAGENPHSLAAAVDRPKLQGQIWRFLEGQTREPRQSTLEPIAAHYDVPVEAFRDRKQARAQAIRLGLPIADIAAEPTPDAYLPVRAPTGAPATVAQLGAMLARHTAERQKTLAGVLSRFACEPSNAETAAELTLLLQAPASSVGKRSAA